MLACACCGEDANDGVPAAGGAAELWQQVIEVDFSLWAATDFAALGDGNYDLDGGSGLLRWTAANTASANAGLATGGFFRRNAADIGDDGASGLRIFHDQSLAATQLVRATQNAPRLSIVLATLIPSFDPTRSYRFELHVTRFDDNGLAFAVQPVATLGLFGAAGTPAGSTARFAGAGLIRSAADNANPTVCAGNATFLPITAYTYQAGDDVIALQVEAQQATALVGQYVAAWPLSTSLFAVGATSETDDNNAANPLLDATMTLEIGNQSRANNTGSVDMMFRRLRVLRGP